MTHTKKIDSVLNYIAESKGKIVNSISFYQDLKDTLTVEEIRLITDKLKNDGYIVKNYNEEISSAKHNPNFICYLTFEGLLFLERGGVKSENKRIKLSTIWTKAKIIASTLNAISIVAIGFFGVYVSYDSKKKDETINIKENKIERLESTIDSLKTTSISEEFLEQKIERIIESKQKEQLQKPQVSTFQIERKKQLSDTSEVVKN